MTQPANPPPVIRFLKAALGTNADGPADAELLARFVADRDQGAFELLVWRHAGMVLRTCRGVLRDHHAAEDATQAAFLALARKGHAIGRREAVAGWLYRVAYRIAVRLAAQHRRHRPHAIPDPDVLPASDRRPDLSADASLVHAEVARLPDRYRTPVLLCFFEGHTHADAAARLGWPVGTVAGRLARAKELLHRRLTQRGVAVPAVGVGAVLVGEAAAAVPADFAARTATAAAAFAAGGAVVPGVSEPITELARGAIRAMSLTKLKLVAGLALVCGAVVAGGAWAVGQGSVPGQGPAGVSPPAAAKPADPLAEKPAERKVGPAQRQRSLKNLKQIMIAIHHYLDTHGHFPQDITDKDGKPLLSWRVVILPYMEQAALYQAFKLDEPWDSEHNKKFSNMLIKLYLTGVEPPGEAVTYYKVFKGPKTPFEPGKKLGVRDVPDGTVSTLGVVEAGPPVPWAKPDDIPYDPEKPLPKLDGPFTTALHVATLDGAVHSLKRNIDEDVLRRLIDPSDGNVVPALKELQAKLPLTTDEEKAELAKTLAANQVVIAEAEKLLKEHVELLTRTNRRTTDLLKAAEQGEQLLRMVEEIKAMNKKLRDELDSKDAPPAPQPPKKP